MDNYLGEIRMFVGNYAPEGWAFCNGQAILIGDNQPLFSLIGKTYGGDGQTNFCLPDLRCRIPLHAGAGTGLPPINLAQSAGTETTQLTEASMPAHTHTLYATNNAANTNVTTNSIFSNTGASDNEYTADSRINCNMYPGAISFEGGQTPIDNVQPFFTVSFIIATSGNYPTPNQ